MATNRIRAVTSARLKLKRHGSLTRRIPADVARKIGHYVYLYVDPRNGRPFYVGKGKGSRVLAHLRATGKSAKAKILRDLKRRRLKPRLEILSYGLPDEATAFRIEAAVIDSLGLNYLTNKVRGFRSGGLGRIPLRDLIVHYRAKPVSVTDPAVLIRINRLYRYGMSAKALYDATRGVWKVNPDHARKAKYALAVFDGVVCEVYEIQSWQPAGSTRYFIPEQRVVPGRWEFVGRIAPPAVRRRYLDKSVRRYLPRGLQSPVVYRNC